MVGLAEPILTWQEDNAGGKLSEHNPKFHIHQLCELQNLRTTKISNLPKLFKKQGNLIFFNAKVCKGVIYCHIAAVPLRGAWL